MAPKLKFHVKQFRDLRFEAERELDQVAREAVAELNDASSWGGYHLHNSNDAYGPGRTIGIANAKSGRVDRVSRLVSAQPKVKRNGTR